MTALGLPAAARAEDTSHAIGAEIALVGSAVRDDLLVPLANTGGGLALGLGYQGDVGPGLLDVAARLGVSVGADRFGGTGLALEHGLGLRYCLPVSSTGAWRLAVGPAIGADADLFAFGDWDDTHHYWIGATWLGVAARAWRPLGDGWRLGTTGELGLVGLVSRPVPDRENKQDPTSSFDYLFLDVYSDPELAWIGNWQLVRLRAELSPTREQSFATRAWRFGAELRFARAADPEPAFALGMKLFLAKAWGW